MGRGSSFNARQIFIIDLIKLKARCKTRFPHLEFLLHGCDVSQSEFLCNKRNGPFYMVICCIGMCCEGEKQKYKKLLTRSGSSRSTDASNYLMIFQSGKTVLANFLSDTTENVGGEYRPTKGVRYGVLHIDNHRSFNMILNFLPDMLQQAIDSLLMLPFVFSRILEFETQAEGGRKRCEVELWDCSGDFK